MYRSEPSVKAMRSRAKNECEPMDEFIKAATEEAKRELAEGGFPIGSVLVLDGKIIGGVHNRRVLPSVLTEE